MGLPIAAVQVCIGDCIVHGVLARLGVVGGAGEGTGIRRIAIADRRADAGLGQIRDADGMGLAVRRAVVVRDHGLRRGVGIAGILAQGTMLHLGNRNG